MQYINIFADINLSKGNKGLHNQFNREDVTPDVARKTRRPFGEPFGANRSCGSGSSSSVLGEISYQPEGLISTESLYHTSHLWTLTRGQHTTPGYQKLPISQGSGWRINGRRNDLLSEQLLTTSSNSLHSHSQLVSFLCPHFHSDLLFWISFFLRFHTGPWF